jgi:hypothetical protein
LKLIYNDSNSSWEFYNLILDPIEKNNIYDETDLKIRELKEKLMNFLNLNKIKNNLIKEQDFHK